MSSTPITGNCITGERNGQLLCIQKHNIDQINCNVIQRSTFSLGVGHTHRQNNNQMTVKSCLVNTYLRLHSHAKCFRIMPVMYASSKDVETTSKELKKSHDAQIGAHIVLRNLHFDDEDVIQRTNELIAEETGRDRLNQIFHTSEPEHHSDDLTDLRTILQTTAFGGLIFGAAISSKYFNQDFQYYNKLTKFDARIKAVRMMNDVTYVRCFIEGCRWSWRLTLFTGSFICVSHAIAIYRNKSSAFEYGVGAAVTGGLLRFNVGLKGMVGGGVIAGAMGMLVGVVIYGIQRASGETQDRRHFQQVYKQQLHQLRLKRLQKQPVS